MTLHIAVGLGSSLGPRRAILERAIRRLAAQPENTLLRASRLYRTPPMRGGSARGWFLNAVALYETHLSPTEFLERCVQIERDSGRRRVRHWGDRTLDLDVLLAGDHQLDHDHLRVPHPGIAQRSFVLLPLREAWPDARDPATGRLWSEFPLPDGPKPVPVGVVAVRRPTL